MAKVDRKDPANSNPSSHDGSDERTSRRRFLGGAAAAAAGATLLSKGASAASSVAKPDANLAAMPPAGFVPFSAPGRVVKVTKAGSLQANQLYPKPEDAKLMLTRALAELTGESDLAKAAGLFVHKDDKVVVKVNGIALRNMSTNKELVFPFIEAMIASGVPATSITVLEQYPSFLAGTRITAQNVPAGVKVALHNNEDATMEPRLVPGTGSTAVINFALVKDHSICGYTGTLKNMTHGCSLNPHDFHTHHASPQIAMLYAQDVIKSRVRLTITDAFKVMYHGGPLDKQPQYRTPYEAVFVSTDPVAQDTIGWQIVEKFRAEKRLKSLTGEGRPPAYIQAAADLGLGIADLNRIQLKEITI
jgi:hypothetical protein